MVQAILLRLCHLVYQDFLANRSILGSRQTLVVREFPAVLGIQGLQEVLRKIQERYYGLLRINIPKSQ